jgi:type I restriction enzyme, S subunit
MSWRALKWFCDGPPEYGLNVPASEYTSDGLRFLRTTDISEDGTLAAANDAVYVEPAQVVDKRHRLLSGDLLFSRSGTLGRCLRYQSEHGPATYAGYLVRFRPRSEVDPRFLQYCAQSQFFQEAIAADAITSTISNFNAEKYAGLQIPWQEHARQRAIADYLDTETARIDALIEKKQRMIELFEERRRPQIQQAIDSISPVTPVPVRYLMMEIDHRGAVDRDVLSVYRDFGVVPKASRHDNFNKTPTDLSNYKSVEAGNVVVNKMKAWQGSLAVSEHEGIVSGDYLVCRWIGPPVVPRYVHYVLRSPLMISEYQVRSSGIRPSQWRLYWDDFSQILFPVCEITDQHRLVEELDQQMAHENDLLGSLGRQLDLLRERRQVLITAAVTGKLEVPGVAA